MKRIINAIVAAFAMFAISAGITSCNTDSMAEMKLLGTWEVEKMVLTMELDGKEVTQTITLDQGDKDMFKIMTFTSDGKLVVTYKNGGLEDGYWKYSDGKLSISEEDSGAMELEFDVDKLTMRTLVFSLTESGMKLSYHFKK